jgi:hypothetical protein
VVAEEHLIHKPLPEQGKMVPLEVVEVVELEQMLLEVLLILI